MCTVTDASLVVTKRDEARLMHRVGPKFLVRN